MAQDDQMHPTIGELQAHIEDLRRRVTLSETSMGIQHERRRGLRGGRTLSLPPTVIATQVTNLDSTGF